MFKMKGRYIILRRGTIIGMIIVVCVLGIGKLKATNEPVQDSISGLPVFYEYGERIIPKPSEVAQPIIEEQIDQTDKLLLWLEELWKDEEVRKTIGEERLFEFINSAILALTNPPSEGEQTLESTAEGGTMGMSGAPLGISQIPGDMVINTNTVWDEDVHLNGKVYVDGAMLVIMPSVEVWNDPNGGIIVQNNGVISARGLPNNPITFTSYAEATNEDYDFAIKIEETALSASTIIYCDIQHAAKGIYIANNKLENPLENNKIENCYDAVVQYGPELTDIYNNVITNSSDDGIEISLAWPSYPGDPNGASNTTQINIEHNLINGSSYGVTVWGVDGPDEAGTVVMKNNLLTGCSQYAIYQSGWMATIRLSNGYYANNEIGNPQTDVLPVYLDDDPFVNGIETHPFVIIQDCNLVDAAYTYDEITYIIAEENIANTDLIGTSTAEDGFPDSGVADIGFHYPNWSYYNVKLTLSADIDNDSVVDANDLQILSENWLCITDPNVADPNFFDTRADLNGDDFVDFKDFALLSAEWLKIEGVGFADIQPTFDGDIDNLTGYVSMNINVSEPNVTRAFALIDGDKYAEFGDLEESTMIGFYTERFTNGRHYVKIVGLDINGNVICSQKTRINFNNMLYCMSTSETFQENKDYHIFAMYSGGNELRAKVAKWDGSVVWTSQGTIGNINLVVPGAIFSSQVYDLMIQENSGTLKGGEGEPGESWENIWERAISKDFNGHEYIHGTDRYFVKFAIFLPNAWGLLGNSADKRKEAVAAIIDNCESRGIKYVLLYKGNCTWINFATVLAASDNLMYVYLVSRGNAWVENDNTGKSVQRTYFKLSGGHRVVSYFDDNEPLGGWDADEKVHSMWWLGFHDNDQLKIVWIDICNHGKFSDMAQAWMDLSDVPILDKLYVSWNSYILTSNNAAFAEWSAFFWGDEKGFGLHGARSYYDAYTEAQKRVSMGTWISGRVGNHGDVNVKFTYQR